VHPIGHALEQVGFLVMQPGRHGSPPQIGAGRVYHRTRKRIQRVCDGSAANVAPHRFVPRSRFPVGYTHGCANEQLRRPR
jgi:hypothetical protein